MRGGCHGMMNGHHLKPLGDAESRRRIGLEEMPRSVVEVFVREMYMSAVPSSEKCNHSVLGDSPAQACGLAIGRYKHSRDFGSEATRQRGAFAARALGQSRTWDETHTKAGFLSASCAAVNAEALGLSKPKNSGHLPQPSSRHVTSPPRSDFSSIAPSHVHFHSYCIPLHRNSRMPGTYQGQDEGFRVSTCFFVACRR